MSHSQQIYNYNMGSTCSNSSDTSPSPLLPETRIARSLISQHPHEIILELANGTIESIPVKQTYPQAKITHTAQPGLFFTSNSRVCYLLSFSSCQDQQFMQAAHAYYLASRIQSAHMVPIQSAYLLREEEPSKYLFILESERLDSSSQQQYADLGELGVRLREKGICWQDREFEAIVIQICRKMAKLHQTQLCGVTNVLIGTDGSVNLLGILETTSSSALSREHQRVRALLLRSLYGFEQIDEERFAFYESECQFKHPDSLWSIYNLKEKIRKEQDKQYEPIGTPSIKFIRDYIQAYFYNLPAYSSVAVEAYMGVGQYQSAKEIIISEIMRQNYNERDCIESYDHYLLLLKAEANISAGSPDHQQAKSKFSSIAYKLGLEQMEAKKFLSAHQYFSTAREQSTHNPFADLYVRLAQTCFALGINEMGESVLLEGTEMLETNKYLHLLYIVYLCDCTRVEEAEKHFFVATKHFSTLQQEICEAKIFMTKALVDQPLRDSYLSQASEDMQKVVVDKYEAEGQTSRQAMHYYYEVLADIALQNRNFQQARDHYHNALIFHKRDTCPSPYRMAVLTAALANCSLMQGDFAEADRIYCEALSMISPQCKSLWHSIKGNLGLCKIKMGETERGLAMIELVLNEVPASSLLYDYNYIFLENVVVKYRKDVQKTLSF